MSQSNNLPVPKKLNVKFVAWLLAILVVICAAVHGLHIFQARRNSAALLDQANRLEAAGELDRAGEYLQRYLGSEPGDTAILERYALLLARPELATTRRARQRALDALEQALRRIPDRHDLRRTLVTFALSVQAHDTARQHLELLLPALPDDAELHQWQGQCEEAAGQADKAVACYREAIRQGAEHPELIVPSFLRLAQLLRAGRADSEADDVIQTVSEAVPDHPEVLLAAAELAQRAKHPEEAAEKLRRGLELHPDDVRMHLALARLDYHRQPADQVVARLRSALDVLPAGRPEVLVTTADMFLELNDRAAARALLDRLAKETAPVAFTHYLRGRLALTEGNWRAACDDLEAGRPQLVRIPDLVKKVDLYLAQCYEHMGNPDLQQAACRRALQVDPLFVEARLMLAAACSAAGQVDPALGEYRLALRQLGQSDPRRVPVLVAVSRQLLTNQLRLPLAQRRLEEVEALLKELGTITPEVADLALLRASFLTARGVPEEARQVLEAARDKQPDRADLWVALAAYFDQQADRDKARAVLDEADKKLGDNMDLRLARVGYWLRHGGTDKAKHLAPLEQDIDKLAAADQARLRGALLHAYLFAGALPEAERHARALASAQPANLNLRVIQLDIAQLTNNPARFAELQAELRQLEGDGGHLWRFAEAAGRLRLAAQGKDRDVNLAEALRLLDDVAKRRASWNRVPALRGEIRELQGQKDQALEDYLQAMKLGDTRPDTLRRAVFLLYGRQRYAEANELLQTMGKRHAFGDDVSRLASDLALRQSDPTRAVELARQVSARSNNPRDCVWLGQTLWAAGGHAEAEKVFRQAIDQAPDRPESWMALISFLAGTDQKDKAAAALKEVGSKVAPADAMLLLAQGNWLLGRIDQAAAHYQQALTARPHDWQVLHSVCRFELATGRMAPAVAHLRQLLDPARQAPSAVVSWVRRNLAVALAGSNSYPAFQEARKLVEETIQAEGATPDNLLAKARVLAAHPAHRPEALTILQGLAARRTPDAEDQFLLARLHDAQRDWPAARQQMLSLLAEHAQARYVAVFVRMLLQHQEIEQAEFWLSKLAKQEPSAPATVELKVRLLQVQGKKDEAVGLLRDLGQAPDAPLGLVAGLLEELDQFAAAEEAWRKYVAQAKQPERSLELAQFLARRKRTAEALALCEQAWQTCSPEAVGVTCVGLVRSGAANDEQIKRVEYQLQKALGKNPNSTALRCCLADFCDFLERFDLAETFYREVVRQDPRHVLALNNLAWLAALKNQKPAEGLEMINRALATAGPLPSLLDTRAVVHMTNNAPREAIADLRSALAAGPTATRHWHLAWAYHAAGMRADAVAQLKRSKDAGLNIAEVHPLERSLARKVLTELEQR
ncbi:hypothetical protein AYO44_12965 [Planctomycetaceae bacterium SCGC AG-212-F19]|nr:hypothetical protein AYO44_12965 [Planctomycetaceae bacterium SCGC AG-212-F19]